MVNDTVIGRIGTIIDLRKNNISKYRRMLCNSNLDEYTKDNIERALKAEQNSLVNAMELENYMGFVSADFEKIKKEYC